MKNYLFLLIILFVCANKYSYSQSLKDLGGGEIHGNFDINSQYYQKDEAINAEVPAEKMLMNAYSNINYTNGNFNTGIRYETYLNTLSGVDKRYDGSGIAYRYANYKIHGLDITVGNYYEQFGNGLVFRSYDNKSLGYDNAMDGVRLKYSPTKGMNLKALIGKQRYYFELGEGIVRGIDGEFVLNELLDSLENSPFQVILGASFVSKYQEDNNTTYILPENVGAYAGRFSLIHSANGKQISFGGEYAEKINDPNFTNGFIYKKGHTFLINTSYSQKGLGMFFSAKRVDNMDFRSDRNKTNLDLLINNLPAITKNHTYSLLAMYPYATQTNGEIGFNAEITYNIPRNTLFGGKYGTNISLNYSQVNGLDKTAVDTFEIGQSGTDGYNSDFFVLGNEVYFKDFNIEIHKKINKKNKFSFVYQNLVYNNKVIREKKGVIYANVFTLDFTHKFKSRHTFRTEIQGLFTEQDHKDWALVLLEYNRKNLFFILQDQYNYGDTEEHYYLVGAGYNYKANRFEIRYGKQKEGVSCAGGVCRVVPASYGLTFMVTSSF